MTRTCSFELSCTTFAITDACACRIEPGGRVAKPTVCALAAIHQPAAAAAAEIRNSMGSLLLSRRTQSLPLPNEGWPRRGAVSTIGRVKPLGVLLASTLAACGGEIATSPDAVRIEPFWVADLRAPQSVVLSNGLSSPVKYQIRNESITWEL